ncbi:MAG TPA: phosphodiesterase YaeI, partial [Oligoflexia bacterium]|nr:phosphodiesterase YaeI [Oligoflexia bacterium]
TPDLICLTGDYISSTLPSAQEAARYSRLLRILSDAAPCAACLGNHDGGQWASRFGAGDSWEEAAGILSDANIRCLVNETTMYQCRGQQVVVAGTADLWSAPVAFDETNQNLLHTAAPLIMLAHNPDTKDAIANLPWDIMLSGHTHGGQLIYPFSNKTPFSVVRDRRFMAGLHRWNDRWLHVSRGLGTWRGVRINCPPEMTLLSLESCN